VGKGAPNAFQFGGGESKDLRLLFHNLTKNLGDTNLATLATNKNPILARDKRKDGIVFCD
jgi:hypothetical protein